MTGIYVELDTGAASAWLGGVLGKIERPAPLFAQINEYLLRSHRQRFREQRAPDGTPWEALSPAYQRRKHRNQNRILTLRGYLQGTLRGQYDDTGLEFGTDRLYGAIQHFGGEIKMPARQRQVFFRQRADGTVSNRFVKRKNSNFAQTADAGPYTIKIPARPWLGLSSQDDGYIVQLALRYLQNN